METVALKNGTSEPKVLVAAIMVALQAMIQREALAFYDAVQIAKNPDHQPFDGSGAKIEKFGLISGGSTHSSIRNIILSAIEGDDNDLTLVRPEAIRLAEAEAPR